jgi:hypothetical protein
VPCRITPFPLITTPCISTFKGVPRHGAGSVGGRTAPGNLILALPSLILRAHSPDNYQYSMIVTCHTPLQMHHLTGDTDHPQQHKVKLRQSRPPQAAARPEGESQSRRLGRSAALPAQRR